jgi:DNA-binding NarL/FixJ family response regulator
VDDHQVVRLGLANLLGTVPHFTVVGEAGTVSAAVAEARSCRPDVVIMDVRLPDGSGVDACREIRSLRPQARVIMLTSYSDEDAVLASIMAGAAGYVLKQVDPQRLIEAVETVAQGGSLLDPGITETVMRWMRHIGIHGPGDALSHQERRIVTLIGEGKTNREIAEALYLSEHTVKAYVSHILHKLHLTRRTEAAAYAARHWPDAPA